MQGTPSLGLGFASERFRLWGLGAEDDEQAE